MKSEQLYSLSPMADPITIADIYALFQASQAEADRRAIEADRRIAELNAEADRRLQRLERIAANTSREVAGLTTRWGQFVENLVAPAVVRLFQERGIEVQEISRRLQSNRPGAEMEIDIFAVDGEVAVAIEVKSRLSRQDVNDFLERLGRFRQAFPHYADYQIYGAVAAIEIDQGVDRYAYQQGLFVIKQTGDTVEIANDTAFQPTAW
jgi:RecB family endonuclease NucS